MTEEEIQITLDEVDRFINDDNEILPPRNAEIAATSGKALNTESLQVEEEPIALSTEEIQILEQAIATQDSEIPVNSATITMEETTSRFSSAIWYDRIKEQTVTLAGLGGIGSYVAFLLGRMQIARLSMYDDDRVESVNMSGQLYATSDIGNYKANSIYNMVKNYANFFSGNVHNERFTSESIGGKIMICGFDNMEARKTFFTKWLSHLPSNVRKECLFIDGRLAAEEFQVLCIQGDDERAIQLYQSEWLFSDAEAEETLCSYKQTTFMANMIGSVIVNLFVNFIANLCDPIFPRDVPFLTTYDAERMYFKVEM